MLCKNSWHFLLLANQTNSNWLQWVVRARSWLSGSEECCWIKGIKAGAKQLLLVSVHDGPVSSQWSAAVKIHSWAGSSRRRRSRRSRRRSRSEFQQCRLLSAIVAPALPLLASELFLTSAATCWCRFCSLIALTRPIASSFTLLITVSVTSVLNEAPVQYFVLLPVLLST